MTIHHFKTLILKNFPELKVEIIEFMGEGWMSKAFLVNNEWVFRFPKTREGSDDLEKEIKMLPYLTKKITLAIPQFDYIGRQDNELLFVGYKKLPGTTLNQKKWSELTKTDLLKIAQQLAQFLDELHSFPVDKAKECNVPDNNFRKGFSDVFKKVQGQIFPLIDQPLRDQLTSLFNHYLNEAGYFEYQPTLIHADLSPNHYLYEDKVGELTGIIDFGDLHIGDPDFEYTYILEDGGEAFARQVMELRAEKEIDFLLKKVRIFVVFTHVATILEGLRLRDESMIDEGIATLRGSLDSFQSPL